MRKLLIFLIVVFFLIMYSEAQCNKKQETAPNQKGGLVQILDEVLPKENTKSTKTVEEAKPVSAGQRKTL